VRVRTRTSSKDKEMSVEKKCDGCLWINSEICKHYCPEENKETPEDIDEAFMDECYESSLGL